jgi:subtilase family serine protease
MVPSAMTPGTYYVLACADDTGLVAEDVEDNNCRASASPLVVPGPDLLVTALSNPPARASALTAFRVTSTVKNQGQRTVWQMTSVRYYLSTDTQRGGDVRLLGMRMIRSLAAGASSTGTATVGVPTGVAPGAYYLLACADDGGALTEIDEANNCMASATTVLIGP